jgi:hypothetical protein
MLAPKGHQTPLRRSKIENSTKAPPFHKADWVADEKVLFLHSLQRKFVSPSRLTLPIQFLPKLFQWNRFVMFKTKD